MSQVLLLGHRGAVHPTAPENTLTAVERALRQGADGVEVDVRVTADGVPVCHHDVDMRRTAGDRRQVAGTAYALLPWVGSHRVARLSEVVDLVAGRARLVVELKSPGPAEGHGAEPVEALLAVLRRHRLDDVVVSSFDRLRLRAVRAAGLCPTALVGRPVAPLDAVLQQALQDGHPELHPHVSSVLTRPHVVGDAHRAGRSVVAWTVDRPCDLRLLDSLGVGGVICDDPLVARAALRLPMARVG